MILETVRKGECRFILAVLVLAVCVAGLTACAPSGASLSSSSSTPTATVDPLSRIHNATPSSIPFVVAVRFRPSTTFDQAVAILGSTRYPWGCDDPRTPIPPSLDEQRAAFDTSHTLFIEYPSWDQLTHIAASPQVTSVDGVALYQCT
jgi:hypothetical protein